MEESKWGVHIAHCCVMHGCKYGDEDCPVETEQARQKYLCESCDHSGIKSLDELTRQRNLQRPGQVKIELSAEPDENMAEQGTPYSWCLMKYREPDGWDYTEWVVEKNGWSTTLEQAFVDASEALRNLPVKKELEEQVPLENPIEEKAEVPVARISIPPRYIQAKEIIDKIELLVSQNPSLTVPMRDKLLKTAMQSIYFYFNQNFGYAEAEVSDYFLVKEPTVLDVEKLHSIVNYIEETLRSNLVAVKPNNLPIVFVAAEIAMNKGISSNDFNQKVSHFFSDAVYKESDYKQYTLFGASKRDQVQKRLQLLKDAIFE